MSGKRLRASGLSCAALGALIAVGCDRAASTPKLSVETAPSSAVATEGPPHVVAFDPPLGATNVDPARTVLSVTFDRPMDREGWAWVIEDRSTAPDIGDSTWDAEVRTNSTPVRLEPGRTYVVWINSPQYAYFKDLAGRPATPVRWSFTTRGAAPPATPGS